MTEKLATGGRVRIKPDGTSEYVRYYDPPLTKEEQAATAWFDDLSPSEQYREVRRMKWNLEQAQADRDDLKRIINEQRAELDRVQAKLATHTPHGYVMPKPAADLLELAKEHGWKTGLAWTLEDDGLSAALRVAIRRAGSDFELRWECEPGGRGRMPRPGLARAPRRGWFDAPSLKKIREVITSAPEESGL